MNQPENPDAASLVIDVPTDGTGQRRQPQSVGAPPVQRNTMTLRWKQASWNIPARMEMTTLLVKSRIASVHLPLVPDTVIDGNGGNDMLTVKMSGNFAGFFFSGCPCGYRHNHSPERRQRARALSTPKIRTA